MDDPSGHGQSVDDSKGDFARELVVARVVILDVEEGRERHGDGQVDARHDEADEPDAHGNRVQYCQEKKWVQQKEAPHKVRCAQGGLLCDVIPLPRGGQLAPHNVAPCNEVAQSGGWAEG